MALVASKRDLFMARERWRAGAAQMVVMLAGRPVRLLILGLAALLTLWQLYIFAWRPLQEKTDLPAGLASVRAELDTASLSKIREARAQRLQHPPNLFLGVEQYFR